MSANQEPKTIIEALGIERVEATPERMVMRMKVTPRTHQPMGILHGGASVVLAETVASAGTYMHIDREKQAAVGMEINANHIRPKRDGVVTAVGVPVHKGRTSMVWDIRITDEEGKLICISRCTMAIIDRRD